VVRAFRRKEILPHSHYQTADQITGFLFIISYVKVENNTSSHYLRYRLQRYAMKGIAPRACSPSDAAVLFYLKTPKFSPHKTPIFRVLLSKKYCTIKE
jgi:hypothetical protein